MTTVMIRMAWFQHSIHLNNPNHASSHNTHYFSLAASLKLSFPRRQLLPTKQISDPIHQMSTSPQAQQPPLLLRREQRGTLAQSADQNRQGRVLEVAGGADAVEIFL